MYPSLILPWSDAPSEAETVYRLAGYRKTKGTLFLIPPPQESLREAFNAPPRPKTRMSSGAVALCKHFERGGASSEHGRPHTFWTLPVGSNEGKTEMASHTLDKMLAEAVWKNVMLLHPGIAVYEIRNPLGYGMRWTLELREVEGEGNSEDVQARQDRKGEVKDNLVKSWEITKTIFRGFLEPIAGMDHELAAEDGGEAAA
ncbi:uncharacterized protein A1O9_01938 [Exophiala aquamarina CBS 119918]|uniref:Uncharacterized protein n=1 Tax=Exophiala aquamarina CBS 119918 TaxID=1182545 RepID=A0A072PM23_9EURO|nr:uncharacterized protein A1O9_01938 [Exophiala aquamarina CBS 119918]KEF60378.1 hypothetical protein A1O9_01938 [Exophiala aquamarina CBS 119918]